MHFATSIETFTFTSILNMAIALFSAGGRQQLSWQIYIHALRGASRCGCSRVGASSPESLRDEAELEWLQLAASTAPSSPSPRAVANRAPKLAGLG